jgi:hypothetical protein
MIKISYAGYRCPAAVFIFRRQAPEPLNRPAVRRALSRRTREAVVQGVGDMSGLSAALVGVQYTYKESHF